jgi:hypothetical protein
VSIYKTILQDLRGNSSDEGLHETVSHMNEYMNSFMTGELGYSNLLKDYPLMNFEGQLKAFEEQSSSYQTS